MEGVGVSEMDPSWFTMDETDNEGDKFNLKP